MRSSIGSAWIFSICLTFILLFTAYLAISVNYAKAFRIKNNIIDRIEENEGYTDSLDAGIEDYLVSEGYDAYGECDPYVSVEGKKEDWVLDKCLGNDNANVPTNMCSVCLYRSIAENQKNQEIRAERSYYRVVTFFRFELPAIKGIFPSFQVAGESRYIYDFANAGK